MPAILLRRRGLLSIVALAAPCLALAACDGPLRGDAPPAVQIAPLAAEPAGRGRDPGDLLTRPITVLGSPTDLRITPDMPDANRFLAGGWAPPERWENADPPVVRRWSMGRSSRVRFDVQRVEPLLLSLQALPYQPPGGRPQEINVWLNGEFLTTLAMDPAERRYEVPLPAAALREGRNLLRFAYLWTEQPGRVDPGTSDPRPLAIAFSEITIGPTREAPPAPVARVSIATPARAEPVRGLLAPGSGPLALQVWPPPDSTLEVGWIALRSATSHGGPLLRIEAEWDGGRRTLLERRPRRVEELEAVSLPLPAEAPGALRLHFSVEGGGEEPALVWLEPRIVPPAAPAAPGGPAAPLRVAPGTNVLMIVVDAASRDRFSLHGRATRTSPHLERLAEEAVVFDAAYANASHTLPSTSSLFTSRLPPEHGAIDEHSRLGTEHATLAELLARHGYRTAAFSANPYVSRVIGTTRGFARVDELFRDRGAGEVARAEELVPPVRAFLEEHRDEAFFAYVHLLQPHEPYDAAPARFYAGRLDPAHQGRFDGSQARIWEVYRRHLFPTLAEIRHIRGLYEGNLAYADFVVGELCRTLRELGLWDRTIVVVTSDHGEALGENGAWGHGEGVTREQIAIPLVVRLPAGLVAPGRRSDLVQTVDVMPSLLDLLGIEPPPDVRGRPWFLPHGGHEWPRAVLSVALGRNGIASLVTPEFKYSHDPMTGAERLLRVPAEEAGPDLRWQHPVTFEYLAEEATRLLALATDVEAGAPAEPLPSDVVEALRVLGYVE